MKAARILNRGEYSASDPAPSSAIQLEEVPKPTLLKPGNLMIQVKASTVIRDSLTWPEVYSEQSPAQLGNDFAGTVIEIHNSEQDFKVGQAVYGMTHADRGATWAEYALVTSEEAYVKPDFLSWEEAAALPLSAMTADQALFTHAGLPLSARQPRRLLVTGAAGGVGILIVSFAAAAGHHVIAATSSNGRNEAFLKSRGASECIEYGMLSKKDKVDVIIDTVGGEVLRSCWTPVDLHGHLITIESASWNFVEEHKKEGLSKGKEDVKALFFIVEPTRESMRRVSNAVITNGIKGHIAKTIPFERAREAYDLAYSRDIGRGKVVLKM